MSTTTTTSTAPWDIYAEQLFPLRYGHPLWMPEPEPPSDPQNEPCEVLIGDVGYLEDGGFKALFNSMVDETSALNNQGVPGGFKVFSDPHLHIGPELRKITAEVVASRSVAVRKVQVGASVNLGTVPASIGARFRFQTQSDMGAMVMLSPPGLSKDIDSKMLITDYMRNNFESWLKEANDERRLGLRLEQLLFISGTLKTTQWTVATLRGCMSHEKDAYISAQFDPVGKVFFDYSNSVQTYPTINHRTGPPPKTASRVDSNRLLSFPSDDTPPSSAPNARNQCLFIHYYKIKRRLPFRYRAMQAAAGPHQLPPGDDNPGADAMSSTEYEYDFETDAHGYNEAYDPVNHLLDYILQAQPEASIAIASDLDLITLFGGNTFPQDISGALNELSPLIDLGDDGVGTISAGPNFVQKRRRDEDLEADEGDAQKHLRYHDSMSEDLPMGHSPLIPQHGSDQNFASWSLSGPSHIQQHFPHGPQVAWQGMQHQEAMNFPQGPRFEQSASYPHVMPYQQGMLYEHSMEYGHGRDQPLPMHLPPTESAPQPEPTVSTGYSMRHSPPEPGMHRQGMPAGVVVSPQDFMLPLPSPQALPHHEGVRSLQHGSDLEDVPEDDQPEDETASRSGEKAAGKRPDVGGATTAHLGPVTALVYSADGKYLASGSGDSTIVIWDAPSNAVLHRVPLSVDMGHEDTISELAFSRNNSYLASTSRDKKVIIWNVESGRKFVEISIMSGQAVCSIGYTPDGRYLIAGMSDGALLLWHADTYELAVKPVRNTAVTFIAFSPDGLLMATGGTRLGNVCDIWETENIDKGKPLNVLQGQGGTVCAAAFSPDSKRIITASNDGSSWIWNAHSGESLVMLHGHEEPVWTVAFSPDGKLVASGSSDSTVKVYDSYKGECQLSLEPAESEDSWDMINAIEFSPDGKYLVSAASNNTVRLWNVADGTIERTYNEHDDNVTTVMFASDGSTLASGSHDGTVQIRPFRMVHD